MDIIVSNIQKTTQLAKGALFPNYITDAVAASFSNIEESSSDQSNSIAKETTKIVENSSSGSSDFDKDKDNINLLGVVKTDDKHTSFMQGTDCFLCNVHLNFADKTNIPNKPFINLHSIIYRHLNKTNENKPATFVLGIMPISRNNIPLVKQQTLIPFKAYLNNISMNSKAVNHAPLSNVQYFANISLSKFKNPLQNPNNHYEDSHFPSLEVAEKQDILFTIYNTELNSVASWKIPLNLSLSLYERKYYRFTTYDVITNDPKNDLSLVGNKHLKNSTELCFLNYKNRYFLVGSIKFTFSIHSLSVMQTYSPLNRKLIINKKYTIIKVTSSKGQLTTIGCHRCSKLLYRPVRKVVLNSCYEYNSYFRGLDESITLNEYIRRNGIR
ncbi:hypothetical protein C6P40_002038 [Pichia californica]|uniref:Uncharacterized protein n=1 Tax=Pichia californica TaxID=460514 RepID=A0A9P6WI83_9ASCO|nr:hypothetical protein C6P40_002038 [[Candida] californica]